MSCPDDTDLNGEAGLCAFTALFAVNTVTERADDGGVRSEGQIVVSPLAEDCNQVSVEWVVLSVRVCCP